MDLNDLHNLMDQLSRSSGSARPDLEARDMELRTALDAHPEWMAKMRARDAFDVKLCEVMPQVDVPEGLKERLHAAVAEQQSQPTPLPAADRDQKSRRRAWGMMTAASLLFAAAVCMVLNPLTPDLTVTDIENDLPQLWDALDTVSLNAERTDVALPIGWDSRRLRFPDDWKLHDVSDQPLAFRKLEFFDSRGRGHTGLLASLPASSFSSSHQPISTNPFTGGIRYLRISDGSMLAIVTWTDTQSDRVYFLAVPAEGHTLKALQQLLYVQPA